MKNSFCSSLILLLLMCAGTCFAQTGKQVEPEQNQKIVRDSIPKPIGYVSDYEDLYTDAQVHTLDSIILAVRKLDEVQIAVVTLDTSFTTKENFDSYALRLANAWGVGEKGKDNGVVIAISKGYKRIRILNGYGIEKHISDDETKALITDYFIPFFKTEAYYKGTLAGLQGLIALLQSKKK